MIITRKYLLAVGVCFYYNFGFAQGGISQLMMQAEPVFSRTPLSGIQLDEELSAIYGTEADSGLYRHSLKKKHYYRKKNGKLYRFRYHYVDGKMVYSEDEVSDFIVDETESYLRFSLQDGGYAALEPIEEKQNRPAILKDETGSGWNLFLITEWAKIKYPSTETVGPRRSQRPYTPSKKLLLSSLFPPQSSGTKKTGRSTSRSTKGKVTKPASSGKTQKRLMAVVMSVKGSQLLKKAMKEADSELKGGIRVSTPVSSEDFNNPMFIPMYNDVEDLWTKAEEFEIADALESRNTPDIEGLTEEDWEGIAAFNDLVNGLLFNGRMTYTRFKIWMEKRKKLRQKTGGFYSSIADVYIDLCLQYMALKHGGRTLLLDWDYFIDSIGNNYIHVQQIFSDHPGITWDVYCQQHSHLVTKITADIEKASNEDIVDIRKLLSKATGLADDGFPEYLFTGRE